jgi:preprotein translocase subunit YajC
MQATPAAAGNGLELLMLVAIFGIFYFLFILPMNRRQKRIRQMHSSLKAGDRIITSGGLRGTIVSIKDDTLQLRLPPDSIKIEVVRSAVAHVVPEEGAGSKS